VKTDGSLIALVQQDGARQALDAPPVLWED
jgi:hypothetical protein